MILAELIKDLNVLSINGNAGVTVTDICSDSRHVTRHSLFAAVRGTSVDGHHFIDQAIEKGAVAVLCEELPLSFPEHVTFIQVKDSASALGDIASAFFGHPSEKLKLTGITGTNGKTTIATLLFDAFREIGYSAGLLSTVVNRINEKEISASYTTPDQISLNRILSQMVDEGCTHCFMEVSSHAVVQKRIAGVRFTGAVFTNLTHDHLDYHGDFASYRDAKKTFFDMLPASAFALTNLDDPNGLFMLQNCNAGKNGYSLKKSADFKGIILENSIDGLQMRIDRHEIHFHLKGRFNASNLMAIYGTMLLLGVEELTALSVMSGLRHVDGRFHPVENNRNIHAIVDYAHTPDAVENVLKTLDELRTRNETLFVIIGAGGNRDKTKRPVMAAIASKYADRLILTSDNPRNEDPQSILEDMKKGLNTDDLAKTLIISDRREAIKTACLMASAGDIILLAGKGHEKYQEINGVKHPFDDVEILKDILNT